ncbi:proton-conducting transporter membrane subunit [Stappia sp. ES.058]|uniref:proton-conducting transporter transmembrane domain-containing protein n=1 Tax=Stappia sp. ES.058 TaxID=1881061 RepID=UPI000879D9A3|nr:proton-conducting transporter membrane subunit [Stappia sp. ES.058]SDU46041.1 NAD(P)H-quinone oxidoreductase subunit 5 [Stappia sp. ES.058]
MTQLVAFLPLAAPIALLVAACVALNDPSMRPRHALASAGIASMLALGAALAGVAVLVGSGPLTSPLIGAGGIGLSVRLDALSVAMLALVATVGVVVIRFSATYLDGDARQGIFTGRLCLTLAAVMLLVTSGNTVQLALAWIATSLALHGLLVFYGDRPRAVIAARKKFIAARLGDLLLIGALVPLTLAFGTTDIATILQAARDLPAAPAGVGFAAVLIALAALVKSAAFPTHGWLPEVMDTPTPVSALLHAGIINAGGFLAIRFADILVLFTPSLHLLAIVGGFTALFGAVVMLTQTSVKVSLAWSTVAQMGFMLLQCGLGLFALATLHLVAHSLYKAHAFLSAGSAAETVGETRALALLAPAPGRIAVAGGLALGVTVALSFGFSALLGIFGDDTAAATAAASPQAIALGAILVFGLTLMLVHAGPKDGAGASGATGSAPALPLGRLLAVCVAVTLAYLALHALAQTLYAGVLPPPPVVDVAGIAVMLLAVTSFALVTVFQLVEPARAASPAWRAARVHLANGLYVNTLFNRLAGAYTAPGHSKA